MINKKNIIFLSVLFGLTYFYFFNVSPSSATAPLPAPNHQMWFGYYHVDSQYGDFKTEVKDYTNIQIILEESWIRPPDITNLDIAKLNEAFDESIGLGHKIVYMPSKNSANWDQSINFAKPYWNYIEFIYLYDEPGWNKGTTEQQISNFKQLISAAGLSQKPIAINYTSAQILNGDGYQAGNLDIVGIEAYMDVSQQNSNKLVEDLNKQIDQQKQKIGNKKIFIVIQAYDRNGTWTNLNSLISMQTPPYLKAYNDSRVIGLFAFTYARPGGTKDNGILKESHQTIWNAISGQVVSPPSPSAQTLNLGPGVFPDVAFYQNRIWVTYQTQKPNAVILLSLKPDLTDRKEEKRFTSSGLAYSRLYPDSNGILWHSWRDADDKIKLWRNDKPGDIETVSTERSGANGAIMGYGKIAWHSFGIRDVFIRDLKGGQAVLSRSDAPPTGISRILPNETTLSTDEDRNLFDWGLEPSFAGVLTIVADTSDGNNIRYNNDASTQFSIFPGESFTPHAATDGSTNYTAATWGKSGVRVAVFQGSSSNGDMERGGIAGTGTIDDNRTPIIKPFSSPTQPTIPNQGLPGFGQLISTIFTWSLSVLGIVVFVMIFYAGFKWFTAAGNTAKVNEARSQITNAITGAIILLAAYIILYTLNPDLVGGVVSLPGVGK
ncbi:MAG: pilin [Patescibacteria group bacterium]